MNNPTKIRQFYSDMILGMPKLNKINKLLDCLVSSDSQILELERDNEQLVEKIKELENSLSVEKKKNKIIGNVKPKNTLNTNDIEVHSSEIITTVFDYEEDEGMPYFKIPNKEIANEILIDSGLALCEYKIKIHLEVIS